ncbi:hypothetical protein J3F84DRAFT_100122 [Trichoderma pleuroticola]
MQDKMRDSQLESTGRVSRRVGGTDTVSPKYCTVQYWGPSPVSLRQRHGTGNATVIEVSISHFLLGKYFNARKRASLTCYMRLFECQAKPPGEFPRIQYEYQCEASTPVGLDLLIRNAPTQAPRSEPPFLPSRLTTHLLLLKSTPNHYLALAGGRIGLRDAVPRSVSAFRSWGWLMHHVQPANQIAVGHVQRLSGGRQFSPHRRTASNEASLNHFNLAVISSYLGLQVGASKNVHAITRHGCTALVESQVMGRAEVQRSTARYLEPARRRAAATPLPSKPSKPRNGSSAQWARFSFPGGARLGFWKAASIWGVRLAVAPLYLVPAHVLRLVHTAFIIASVAPFQSFPFSLSSSKQSQHRKTVQTIYIGNHLSQSRSSR